MKISRLFLAGLLMAAAVGLVFSMAFNLPFRLPGQKEETATRKPLVPPASVSSLEEAFTTIADEVKPAVVNISAVQVVKGSPFSGLDDAFEDWFFKDFRDFFGPQKEYRQESLGSGFIFKVEGDKAYLLTNNHVVARADEIKVKLGDGDELKVLKVQGDQRTDVAMVTTEAKRGLKTIRLGDSDKIKVGQWVIACGNPFGFDRTVTVGIISGTGRHLGQGLSAIEDFIQTDAAINRGNSGGPLLNIKGEVIGINTAIIDPSRAQGVGFAIPINMAKDVVNSIQKYGRVSRGWLGVIIQPVSQEIAEAFKLPDRKGALVSDITAGSPAEKAGLKKGDVIREVDGRSIETVDSLSKLVRSLEVGKEVTVKFIRRGEGELSLKVKIGEMPEEAEMGMAAQEKAELGLTVQDISPEIARRFRLSTTEGVIVAEVEPGSPAERAGLQPRDIISEVNGKAIKDVTDYNKAIVSLKEGENIVLLVRRGEYTIFQVVKPRKKEK